jgi:hypothetical protein
VTLGVGSPAGTVCVHAAAEGPGPVDEVHWLDRESSDLAMPREV